MIEPSVKHVQLTILLNYRKLTSSPVDVIHVQCESPTAKANYFLSLLIR